MNAIETLKEIILDNQERDAFTGVPRDVKIIPVPNKAAICIGVRRCGKTTLLAQRIAEVKTSYGRENVLSVNFFDDRLTEVRDGQLYLVLEAYYALYPQKKGERIFCFFDELQECTGWEPFVDRLLRDEDVEVYITGSSAKMLSTEIATQMRGRSLTWELFPFSFTEYVDILKINSRKINSETRYLLQHAFETYYECGGFPEVHKVDKRTRVKIHQEYYKAILHRDVIERFDAIHPKAVMQIAYRLISSVSSLYTLNRVTEYLKSLGYKLSKEFVSDCISWFEDAYFLFTVRKYDKSIAKQNLNAKKIYCIDHSLVASVSPAFFEKKGYLLENMIFLHLRRKSDEIYYYRTLKGLEVDFYYFDKEGKRELVQVAWEMNEETTKKRELKALFQAMDECGLKEGTIVSYMQTETIIDGENQINIVPAWKFILN